MSGLEDGDCIQATLMNHSVEWHKKYILKFYKKSLPSRTELNQLQNNTILPVLKQCAHDQQSTELICLFCNKAAATADVHHAATKGFDKNVRRCATEFGDTELKLSEGEVVTIMAEVLRLGRRHVFPNHHYTTVEFIIRV